MLPSSRRASSTRGGLIRGTVDVIIAPDIPELARTTIQMCLKLKEAAHLTKQAAIVPFVIYTSENVAESTGITTMFLGNKKELYQRG
jgi:hypothetical protein